VATFTSRMGYKKPDGSDPFLRTDYTDLLDTLDANPGSLVCTSTSHPSWAAGQAGRSIYETDTRRVLWWDGTSFKETLIAPSSWTASAAVNATYPTSTNNSLTVGSITTTRAGVLTVWLEAVLGFQASSTDQSITVSCLIDGTSSDVSGGQYETQASMSGASVSYRSVLAMGSRAISAGTHTVGIRVTIGSGPVGGRVGNCGFTALLTSTSDR
jgi:hypothetical protein